MLLWTLSLTILCTPNVGIQKDWFPGKHEFLVSFSAILKFSATSDGTNPVSALSDAQLVGLCAKAFDEMHSTLGDYEKPMAMALLAVDNNIYFASSIRSDRGNWLGKGRGIEEQRPQILARAAGAARIAGNSHRIGGFCGEINIMDLYFAYNRILNFAGKMARIVVWGKTSGPARIFDPCAAPTNGYGCGTFLRAIANPMNPTQPLNEANLRVIAKETNRDENWPDGVKFGYVGLRPIEADKEFCLRESDEPFDPDHPDQ